jgi:lysophospholipase L1-like esterase
MANADVVERGDGPLLRTLGRVLTGVREAEDPVPTFAKRWRQQNEVALAAGEPVWVALGDSLTQGIGASSFDGTFVRQLQRRLAEAGRPTAVVNLSVSGARIEDVISKQIPQIASLHEAPAIVTCTVGNNDLLKTFRVKQTTRALAELFEALPANTAVATLPATGSVVASYINRSIRDQAPRRGHRVADVMAHSSGWRSRIARDGFHPNDAGYQVWTSAFSETLIDTPISA